MTERYIKPRRDELEKIVEQLPSTIEDFCGAFYWLCVSSITITENTFSGDRTICVRYTEDIKRSPKSNFKEVLLTSRCNVIDVSPLFR